MTPQEALHSNLGIAIGAAGPAGSGKTTLLMRLFPRTRVISLDPNFVSGLRYLEKLGKLSNVTRVDTVLTDDAGKPVRPCDWYKRMFDKMSECTEDKDCDAIFVDGATQITDAIMASPQILNAQKISDIQIQGGKESYANWGTLGVTWRGLVTEIRRTGKKFLLAMHERKEKDESDGIWKCALLVPGQTADYLPALMSDMWRTEVFQESATKWVYNVRTLSDIRHEYLKNTYNLPGLLLQDQLVEKVQAQTK